GDFAASWRHTECLTRYCVAGRYPTSGPPVTATDAESARVLAREFLTAADEWVKARYSADTQS
ncbi:MAG: hypothetical protein KKI08_16925, partial [Armatimonadetes bacterium]|nr:hypothetical protein [Armatimonadota bacterium]